MYSLESKLVNKKIKRVFWPLVQSSWGVWAFFPTYSYLHPLFYINIPNWCENVYILKHEKKKIKNKKKIKKIIKKKKKECLCPFYNTMSYQDK